MKTIRTLLLILAGVFCCASSVSAADYFARGVAYCILDDGSGTFPVGEAGEVFVGTTPDEAPVWAAGTHASSIVTGPMAGGQASVKFYFWARAKEGYTFLGWGSTKTSKTGSTDSDRFEGQAWESKTTLWSAGTEAAPKELVRYAIFRKNAAEDLTGGGVKLSDVSGNTHTFGSTTGEWSVRLNYQLPLAYRDFSGYSEGYGTDKALISAISCTEKTSGATIPVKNARVSGSPTADGTDAYGLVFFPADMPVGTYSVHVPKGLFTTSLGKVTAAADFEVEVIADATPFSIISTSPEQGYAWDASEATQAKETDGIFSVVTITFNKNIARVDTEGRNIALRNLTTGQISLCSNCAVSSTTNKRLGVVQFEPQASGDYSLDLPANVFFDASGNGNEPFTLTFSVNGSSVAPWTLPVYSYTASPANFSTVDALNQVTFSFHRNGYSAPMAIIGQKRPAAAFVTEIYDPDVDYNDPENLPTFNSEDILGLRASLSPEGELTIHFTQPIHERGKVVVNIPAGMVRNIGANTNLSDRELYEQGGCTNATIQVTINVSPTPTAVETLPANGETDRNSTAAAETFGLDGRRTNATQQGVHIVRSVSASGQVNTRKILVK